MNSNTPPQIEYSTLFSSEDSHSCLPISEDPSNKESCGKADSQMHLPCAFLIRAGLFVLLELAFIALASAALLKPIILPVSSTIAEAKGSVTIVAIIWHALALYLVKDILVTVFSAEWTKQYHSAQSSAHRELDIVSRLTTGYIDQIRHIFSKRASHPFRLSFASSLLLIMINGLGPSAMSVEFIPHRFSTRIKVAKLALTQPPDMELANSLALERANLITRLEQVEHSEYGFHSTTPNILVPWPSFSASFSADATITYQSDVIQYNFSCSWEQPVLDKYVTHDPVLSIWTVNDQKWRIYATFLADARRDLLTDPLILPMQRDLPGSNQVVLDDNRLIPFIFAGSNATLAAPYGPWLNLEGVPSVLIPTNETLVSILLCDPHFKISPANVNVTGSSLDVTILFGDSIVKNIPLAGANVILSQSLLYAASSDEPTRYDAAVFLNGIVRTLFLPLPSFNDVWGEGMKPLALEEINQRMNRVLLSSAKAFLKGNNGSDTLNPTFAIIDTNAVEEVQEMALVTSKTLLVAVAVVVSMLIIHLSALLVILRGGSELQPLELENIVKALQSNCPPNSSSNKGRTSQKH